MTDYFNQFQVFRGQIIDSFQNDDNFLVVLLLMGALFFLIALIVGVVICLLLILILIGLISAGITSASILVGIQQKSISKGFKTFFISVSMLGSVIVSIIFFWVVNAIKDWWSNDISTIAGIICGLISGYFLGILLFTATKKAAQFLSNKYQSKKQVPLADSNK